MAKDTSMLRCPEAESRCDVNRFGSVISVDRYLHNDGFALNFNVSLTGYVLTKDEIKLLAKCCSSILKARLNSFECDKVYKTLQGDLFDGLQ